MFEPQQNHNKVKTIAIFKTLLKGLGSKSLFYMSYHVLLGLPVW